MPGNTSTPEARLTDPTCIIEGSTDSLWREQQVCRVSTLERTSLVPHARRLPYGYGQTFRKRRSSGGSAEPAVVHTVNSILIVQQTSKSGVPHTCGQNRPLLLSSTIVVKVMSFHNKAHLILLSGFSLRHLDYADRTLTITEAGVFRWFSSSSYVQYQSTAPSFLLLLVHMRGPGAEDGKTERENLQLPEGFVVSNIACRPTLEPCSAGTPPWPILQRSRRSRRIWDPPCSI